MLSKKSFFSNKYIRAFLILVLVSLVLLAMNPKTSLQANELILFIDPGHGGSDPGALYYYDGIAIKESELNLKISFAVRESLNNYDNVKVYLSREDNETYLSLDERVNMAKALNAASIISIHNNASTSFSANGSEIMIPSGNDGSNLTIEAASLSNRILDHLQELGLYRRGLVKRISETYYYPNGNLADYYGIIRHSVNNSLLGIIVESAFLSNEDDYRDYLSDDEKLTDIGEAIARGIADYYNLAPKIEKELIPFLGDLDRDSFITTYDAYYLFKLIQSGEELDQDLYDINSDGEINQEDVFELLGYTISNIATFKEKESHAIRRPQGLIKGWIDTEEDDPYLNVRRGPSVSTEAIGAYDRQSIIYILRDEDKPWAYTRGICAHTDLIIEGYSSMAYIKLIEEERIQTFSIDQDLVLQGQEGLASFELVIECDGGNIDGIMIESSNTFAARKEGDKILVHMINSSGKKRFLKFNIGEEIEFCTLKISVKNIYDIDGKIYKGQELTKTYKQEDAYTLQDPYITGINRDRKVIDLLNNNAEIQEILNRDGSKASNDALVSTGMKIKIGNKEYIAIIKGDINGDGKVDIEDIKGLQKHLLLEALLENPYFIAGDMNSDGQINALDLAYIHRLVYESFP